MNKNVAILTIDDDEQICFAFNELFKLQGWTAHSASSVEEGLESFKRNKPDIVLIDYHMPHINGVDGVRMLRKLDAQVPIIVFTIEESLEVADEFLEAGASDFALKPIKAPDIISRIKLHLQLLKNARSTNVVLDKGMAQPTLVLIEEYLEGQTDYQTVNEIAAGTGLANQTVYRYLQYLVREGRAEQLNVYGKVGRPKQLYRTAKPNG